MKATTAYRENMRRAFAAMTEIRDACIDHDNATAKKHWANAETMAKIAADMEEAARFAKEWATRAKGAK